MTKATTNTNNPFTTLLRNYETATRNRNGNTDSETAYTKALTDLATACTFSVLKKLCNVGGVVTETTKTPTDTTKTIRTLRKDLARDLHDLDRLTYSVNTATALTHTPNGDIISSVIDKDLDTAVTTLLKLSLGDSIDLVNTAVVAILTETAKADTSIDFMEQPYTVKRLKRKVYIKEVDTVDGYETTTTTAIQEVYKAIRRDIEKSRSIQTANNKYTYLETIATDTDSDTTETIYRRLPKYSGLAYEMVDYRPTPTNPQGGRVIGITADSETVDTTDRLIEKMNLTAKQAKILSLRLSGYGYKAIATYLGVSHNAVINTLKKVQTKATAIGLTPTAK